MRRVEDLSPRELRMLLREVDKDCGYETAAVTPLPPSLYVRINMTVEQAAWLKTLLFAAQQRGVEPTGAHRLWNHITDKLKMKEGS